jgi:8-oxo-dGTP diphosphatase
MPGIRKGDAGKNPAGIGKQTALAYVLHAGKLLVFRHTQHPEAGIQVPGGTVEPGEHPDAAVLREAREETGLEGFRLVALLGTRTVDLTPYGRSMLDRRYFYHLELTQEPPATWIHYEFHASDGTPRPIEFEFYWVAFPGGVPELAGEQGALLPELERRLS